MKIKTKSGFTCEINEKKVGSWNAIEMYTGISKAAEELQYDKVMNLTAELYKFMLGDDGYKALCEHLKDDDGIVDAATITKEFNEIMNLANLKKSKSSQA